MLGVKKLSGQKTFNVECNKEDDCIKYVDYINGLISSKGEKNQSLKINRFEKDK